MSGRGPCQGVGDHDSARKNGHVQGLRALRRALFEHMMAATTDKNRVAFNARKRQNGGVVSAKTGGDDDSPTT